jgi:hypothetical protein
MTDGKRGVELMMLFFLEVLGSMSLAALGLLTVLVFLDFEAVNGWGIVCSCVAMLFCAYGFFASLIWAIEIIVKRALQ